MQISDSHSKASTHPVQLSQDDERVTLCKVKIDEQKLREDTIFFIELQEMLERTFGDHPVNFSCSSMVNFSRLLSSGSNQELSISKDGYYIVSLNNLFCFSNAPVFKWHLYE